MIRTTISLDEENYKELRKKAIDERVPFAKLVNHAVSLYLNKRQADKGKKITGNEFLQRLATYNMKGGPKDFAEKHDKYAWD